MSGASALLVTLLLVSAGCGGQVAPPAPAAASAPATTSASAASPVSPLAAELMAIVNELASPAYEGRLTGTPGGVRARAYLQKAFQEIGLEPAGTAGYLQPFRFKGYEDAANVVGRVKGTDPAAKAIVVTAHYDHDGIKRGELYAGADDNASGVAALLALARHVTRSPLRHPVIFAALDAEEHGLEGAKAFVARPPVPLSQIGLNLNIDMVSRNDRNEIYAAGPYHYAWLTPILEEVARRAAVTLKFGHDRPKTGPGDPDDWTLQADHGEFHKAGVPFVYFGVEDHPDYHKPTDTADKIDPVFFSHVVEMLRDALVTLDARLSA